MISFSVVIPVYNKAPHVAACINSVLNQSYEQYELILINDASTDGSREVIAEFDDPRIRIADREFPGPGGYAARNKGIDMAQNDFVAFLDADDTWHPQFLEKMAEVISNYPEAGFYSSGWNENDANNTSINAFSRKRQGEEIIQLSTDHFLQLYRNYEGPVWTSVAVVRKDIILAAGEFPAGKCRFGGDIDTWLRIMFLTNSLIVIPEPLASYRMDAVNMVTKASALQIVESCMMKTEREINKKLTMGTSRHLSKFVNHFQLLPVRRKAMAGILSASDLRYIRFKADPIAYISFGLYSLFPSVSQRAIVHVYVFIKRLLSLK